MGENICTRNDFEKCCKSNTLGQKHPKNLGIFLIESSDLDNICVENMSFGFVWLQICEDTKKKFGSSVFQKLWIKTTKETFFIVIKLNILKDSI